MCQLFQACRLCFNIIGIRFSCRRRRRHVPCDRSNRVRHDSVSDLACHHCGGVRFAGYICWLSCRSRDGANRRAVARLAGGLRLRRCGLYRRHSVDAIGRLHGAPTRRTGQGGRRQSSASSRGRHARGMISSPSSSNRFAQIGARGVRGLTERTPLSSPKYFDRVESISVRLRIDVQGHCSWRSLTATTLPFPALCFFFFAQPFRPLVQLNRD
jgi:hypothetical protein